MAKDNHIDELDLAFNMLGPVGADEIAQVIILAIKRNAIMLLKAIALNNNLKILNLRMNDIQTAGLLMHYSSSDLNEHIAIQEELLLLKL